jgi:hypothetical protein
MKLNNIKTKNRFTVPVLLSVCFLLLNSNSKAQDDSASNNQETVAKQKPVKNTFESVWISDNQTVLVPIKGTMEMDIQHRFGTWNKGYEDSWGFFAPSNIRLGVSYVPVNKLNIGIGFTKTSSAVVPKGGVTSVA